MSNRRKTREERLHQLLGGKKQYSADPDIGERQREAERRRIASYGNRWARNNRTYEALLFLKKRYPNLKEN